MFYENKKRMRVLKIQRKTLLNMKMVVKYLNFVFDIDLKTKSNYKILNFGFQFIKNMKWHFEYTDSAAFNDSFSKLLTDHVEIYSLESIDISFF